MRVVAIKVLEILPDNTGELSDLTYDIEACQELIKRSDTTTYVQGEHGVDLGCVAMYDSKDGGERWYFFGDDPELGARILKQMYSEKMVKSTNIDPTTKVQRPFTGKFDA